MNTKFTAEEVRTRATEGLGSGPVFDMLIHLAERIEADERAVPVDARAREMLAREFERGHPATQYPEYARIARGSHDILTMAAIRAISAALSEHQADSGRVTDAGLVERLHQRAAEERQIAANNARVAELLAPELALFDAREGHNIYATRMAIDHRNSAKRDAAFADDLETAAAALAAQGQQGKEGAVGHAYFAKGSGELTLVRNPEQFSLPHVFPVFTRSTPTALPAGVPDGLLEHLREAFRRIEDNHAPRRIPAEPGDVDLALAEVIAWLEGKPAPFWVSPSAPSAPEGGEVNRG